MALTPAATYQSLSHLSPETGKLFRIRKTIMKMLKNRNYNGKYYLSHLFPINLLTQYVYNNLKNCHDFYITITLCY